MASNEIIVYDSMLHSNMKPHEKSMISQWFDKASSGLARAAGGGITKGHVISAARAFRQQLETNVVSFGLGALHADVGLDVFGVPTDLVSGGVFTGASLLLGNTEIAPDLLNVGTACANSYSFRKGYDWIAAKKRARGVEPAGKFGQATIHGEPSNDPIVNVASKIK